MDPERKPMPVCTPEEVGISSSAVEAYLDAVCRMNLVMHDMVLVRHGKIVFEVAWKPMDLNFRHRLYSCSKSFVSCAVGKLIDEGLLSLEDKVISFFPDKAPADPSPWLAEMTIRDMLRMSTCWVQGSTYRPTDPDWEATFFREEPDHKPGLVFSYCTTATTMLCMIIKRVSGKEFTEVLRPVFDELGISEDLCCVRTPCGHEWGGSGVLATPHEFAKFANLVMHYGEYEGKQLLPREYLKEATTKQIDNSLYHAEVDCGQGYGYQFWCVRNGGFLFNGMGNQYALCLPDKDTVLVLNGYDELNNKASDELFEAFWRVLYPAIGEEPLPADPETCARLSEKAAGLELLRPEGALSSARAAEFSGKTYTVTGTSMGWKWVRFDFSGDTGTMNWENATGVHALPISFGKTTDTVFPETHYNGITIGKPAGRGLRCFTSAAWTMPNALMIYCHISDIHFGQLRIAVTFDEDAVVIHTRKHAEWFLSEYDGYTTAVL